MVNKRGWNLNKQLSAASIPFNLAVAANTVVGVQSKTKFGSNFAVGGTKEDVWSNGGTLSLLTSAETMNIASSSVNDTSAGTGARTLYIEGLDANYDEISENVTLNGTSNVETTNSYIRVHRMYILTAGSGDTNAGDITATASSAGTVQGHIAAGYGQTLQAMYTVPNGKKIVIDGFEVSVGKGDQIELRLEVAAPGAPFRTVYILDAFQQAGQIQFNYLSEPIPEQYTIKATARLVSGGGTGIVSVNGRYLLINEGKFLS